ncbi:hypothetical protein DSO57_1012712 [Entomophthora muscae]|uniref:Uncharacterized protein n=1 Tax=Entomophthora muscae TaxID=34485 RepID=A0ACC2SIR1_9FUNG|nr:hypothetical protein DSO57_1012712 [Entomophthora muscae]
MKQLLIDKFGGDLSLEVKKDAFMHIAFKPKETLAKFSDRNYMEGQQLIISRQLAAHEAYMACAQALKFNQLLCLHFKAHVVNNSIHHVLILPLVGHFKDNSLAFAFDSQNKLASTSGNMIVWFPDSAQLTCPTHACGK